MAKRMTDFAAWARERVRFLDGGMGTQLQARGLQPAFLVYPLRVEEESVLVEYRPKNVPWRVRAAPFAVFHRLPPFTFCRQDGY